MRELRVSVALEDDVESAITVLHGGDDRVTDAEDSVLTQPGRSLVEHMGDQRLEAGRADHEMNMGRPPRVPAGNTKHLPDRAIVGDGVVNRPHGMQLITPVAACPEDAAEVSLLSVL